jgi:hypothetical protein
MFRRITSIFLFAVLAGGDAATAASLCAGSSSQKVGLEAQPHCKMAPTTTDTPKSCCQHGLLPQSEQTRKNASSCCQISAPPSDQPHPLLPGNSSEEFRLQTQFQMLDSSEPVSQSDLSSMLFRWESSTRGFCPDRSDTYLLASTFRI